MNCTDTSNKKIVYWNRLVFWLLFVVYVVTMFILFHRQTLGNEGYYHSDMKAYILEMQGLDSGYSFPYPVFFKLGALFHLFVASPQLSIALAITVLNAMTPLFLRYYMGKVLQGEKRDTCLWFELAVTVLTFLLLFVSMIYPPSEISLPGLHHKYVGVFSPNPFHNATYNATRPFAVLSFFQFAAILPVYEKEISKRDLALFAFSLFMTTMTKPSFTFVIVPAAGLIMLYRMFRSKFANFLPTVQLGICFIPTFLVLIYQFFGVFAPGGEEESGIGFGIATAWRLHCGNIPLAILLALGFPVFVLLFHYKDMLKNNWYRFSWQLLAVSLFEVLFLYEKGFRLPDMNFSWGYMHGISFVFITSAMILLQDTGKYMKTSCKDTFGIKVFLNLPKAEVIRGLVIAAQWIALAAHAVCGVYYFMGVFAGRSYY